MFGWSWFWTPHRAPKPGLVVVALWLGAFPWALRVPIGRGSLWERVRAVHVVWRLRLQGRGAASRMRSPDELYECGNRLEGVGACGVGAVCAC